MDRRPHLVRRRADRRRDRSRPRLILTPLPAPPIRAGHPRKETTITTDTNTQKVLDRIRHMQAAEFEGFRTPTGADLATFDVAMSRAEFDWAQPVEIEDGHIGTVGELIDPRRIEGLLADEFAWRGGAWNIDASNAHTALAGLCASASPLISDEERAVLVAPWLNWCDWRRRAIETDESLVTSPVSLDREPAMLGAGNDWEAFQQAHRNYIRKEWARRKTDHDRATQLLAGAQAVLDADLD